MQLLVAVINREEQVEEVLSAFLELGITGATVLDSQGMGRLLHAEVPIFAGLEAFAGTSRPRNLTILSVMDDRKVDRAIEAVEEICGVGRRGAGIVFTVPVGRVVGLAPEIGDE
ncbi:MAG TPA: P-II family nitrogen regulator [Longimicrobium sp.]|nr:P-II family nitrogen regulator [Longimicrobium sp.]